MSCSVLWVAPRNGYTELTKTDIVHNLNGLLTGVDVDIFVLDTVRVRLIGDHLAEAEWQLGHGSRVRL